MKYPFLVLFLAIATFPLCAALRLASPFGDHMVLQRGREVPVWGTASAGETVEVAFAGQRLSAVADESGGWRVNLSPLEASTEARTLSVYGSESAEISLSDVLVGEVWLCGGQSNMERQLGLRGGQKPIVGWEAEAASADYPLIRQLYVQQSKAMEPQSTVEASWRVCSPEAVLDFTAVGYFFARDLYKELGVPVGIIHSSWGGTPAEAWTSAEGLAGFPHYLQQVKDLKAYAENAEKAQQDYAQRLASWYVKFDPGSGRNRWSNQELDTSDWEAMQLPVMWEDAGHAGYDGVAWFRKTFELPEAWQGKELLLDLGVIDDVDTTWVNGVEVGSTSGYVAPRVYSVPAEVLQAGENVIAVRVLDTGGGGGLWDGSKELKVYAKEGGAAALSLSGTWQAKFSYQLDDGPFPPADLNQSAGAPTVLFNAMIEPLIPYGIRGVAFYQGEANASRSSEYRSLFPAMIADWRKRWGEGDFPFLFVQIAPFEGMPAEIREAQLQAWQETENTAMVVTIDVGDATDIHPANKEPVGARLALAARKLAYGQDVAYSGPVLKKAKAKKGRMELSFDFVEGGLVAKGGALFGFTIAGKDGVYYPAEAEIVKGKVVVTSPEVSRPVAVRYGWEDVAAGNLFNEAGLPASPFRADAN